MTSLPPESWKVLAWNGIILRVPPHWEVNLLDTSYLQLDDGMGPVMEIKWQQVKGRFSHENHLRKLSKASSAGSSLNFQQRHLPEKWQQALHNFEAHSFEWHGAKIRGEGAIIYCTSCQKATLIQFFQQDTRVDPLVPLGVLSSLQDHSKDGRVVWAVFGLRALMPESFDLLRHSFRLGHYELGFRNRHEQVHLSRWGPAEILLEGGDLQGWFEKKCKDMRGCNPLSFRKIDYRGGRALQAQSQKSNSFTARLWSRMTGKLPWFWARIWYLQPHNQILGVEARGLRPMDAELLEEICRNYEVV